MEGGIYIYTYSNFLNMDSCDSYGSWVPGRFSVPILFLIRWLGSVAVVIVGFVF